MHLTKKHFAIAKALKALSDPESPTYGVHITKDRTEITNGQFVIRMRHSDQQEFDFGSMYPTDVVLATEDACNIAATIGKGHVKAVIATDDRKSVQVEFDAGEIRILPLPETKFPRIEAMAPKDPARFSVAMSVPSLVAILKAAQDAEESHLVFEFRGNQSTVVIRTDGHADDADPVMEALLAPARASGLIDLPGTKVMRAAADGQQVPLQ